MKAFGGIVAGLLVLVLIMALSFGGRLFQLKENEYFAPKEENLRNKVYEQTHAYQRGVMNDLSDLNLDYKRADDDIAKRAIAETVRNRYSNVDIKFVQEKNEDLYYFIQDCINGNK